MSKLPKLKLKMTDGHEEIHDLEEAKNIYPDWRFNHGFETTVLVEGQAVNSYEELVQLATQDKYKDKKFLEVVLLSFIGGG